MVPELTRLDWVKMRCLARFQHFRDTFISDDIFHKKPESATKNVVDELKIEGIFLGFQLQKKQLEVIWKFIKSTPFCVNGVEGDYMLISDYYAIKESRQITHGLYKNPALDCDAIDEIHKNPILRDVARQYLQCEPISHDVKLIWSFPSDASNRQQARLAQRFHYDLDDYRFVKFFFYLTDVTAESGPHVYVKKTHRNKRLIDQLFLRRFSDSYVARVYGKHNQITLTGPAGMGFVEDTYGIHKGTPPLSAPRLLLQFEFATKDYGVKLI